MTKGSTEKRALYSQSYKQEKVVAMKFISVMLLAVMLVFGTTMEASARFHGGGGRGGGFHGGRGFHGGGHRYGYGGGRYGGRYGHGGRYGYGGRYGHGGRYGYGGVVRRGIYGYGGGYGYTCPAGYYYTYGQCVPY
jgi:hypothetical protein